MDESLIKRRLIVLGLMLVAALFAWWPEVGEVKLGSLTCGPTLLCVVFLDVGQGDAIFIQSPEGKQLLIDGGRDQTVLRELGEVMKLSDRSIDFVMATHPDSDHITGLVDVLERYQVGHVIRTENKGDSAIADSLERAIEAEGVAVTYARRGQQLDLGGGVKLEILFPDIDPSKFESNTSSIVARLSYGDTSFLLTGDSPKSIEEYLVLLDGDYLKSDVLKAGHHGSRTSTSELFLEHVSPTYAVISAGKDNSYGHPHVEVTDLLFNNRVETFNTADHGRVVFWSDGKTVTPK